MLSALQILTTATDIMFAGMCGYVEPLLDSQLITRLKSTSPQGYVCPHTPEVMVYTMQQYAIQPKKEHDNLIQHNPGSSDAIRLVSNRPDKVWQTNPFLRPEAERKKTSEPRKWFRPKNSGNSKSPRWTCPDKVKLYWAEKASNGMVVTRRQRGSLLGEQWGDKKDANGRVVTRRRRGSLAGSSQLAAEEATTVKKTVKKTVTKTVKKAKQIVKKAAGYVKGKFYSQVFGKIYSLIPMGVQKLRDQIEYSEDLFYSCRDMYCDSTVQRPMKVLSMLGEKTFMAEKKKKGATAVLLEVLKRMGRELYYSMARGKSTWIPGLGKCVAAFVGSKVQVPPGADSLRLHSPNTITNA